MPTAERDFTWDIPMGKLWEVFADIRNWPRWLEILSPLPEGGFRFEIVGGGVPRAGMSLAITAGSGFTQTWIARDWAPPRLFRVQSSERAASGEPLYEMITDMTALSAASTRCRFIIKIAAEPPAPIGLAARVRALLSGRSRVERGFHRKLDEVLEDARKAALIL